MQTYSFSWLFVGNVIFEKQCDFLFDLTRSFFIAQKSTLANKLYVIIKPNKRTTFLGTPRMRQEKNKGMMMWLTQMETHKT